MDECKPPAPFKVVRKGPPGPDSHLHTFGVVATANGECVRLGYSGPEAMLNGTITSDPKATRASLEKLCDALNEQFARYFHGEFSD